MELRENPNLYDGQAEGRNGGFQFYKFSQLNDLGSTYNGNVCVRLWLCCRLSNRSHYGRVYYWVKYLGGWLHVQLRTCQVKVTPEALGYSINLSYTNMVIYQLKFYDYKRKFIEYVFFLYENMLNWVENHCSYVVVKSRKRTSV